MLDKLKSNLSLLAGMALAALFIAESIPVVRHVVGERQQSGQFAGHDLLFGGMFLVIALAAFMLPVQSLSQRDFATEERPIRFAVGWLALPVAALFAVRLLAYQLPAVHIGMTDAFRTAGFEASLVLYILWLVATAGLDTLRRVLAAVSERLSRNRILNALSTWVAGRHGPLLAIGLLTLVLLAIILRTRAWHKSLGGDISIYLYFGQAILRGAVPYSDFIEFHPPMRHTFNALWALVARLTGLPYLAVFHAHHVVVGGLLLAAAYGVGRNLTGRRSGGLYAAIILMGTRAYLDLVTHNLHVKTTVVLLILVALWCGQQRRWFAGAALLTAASLMWLPAGALGLVLLVAVLLQEGDARRKALWVVAGAGVVLGANVVLLLLNGTLDKMLRQVFGAALSYVQASSPASEQQSVFAALFGWLKGGLQFGDLGLALLMIAGVARLPFAVGWRETLRQPVYSVPVMGALLALGLLMADAQGLPDIFSAVAPMAPFGALAVVWAVEAVSKYDAAVPLKLSVAGLLLVFALSDASFEPRYTSARHNLAGQRQMAQQLEAGLSSGDVVLNVDEPWYAIHTGSDIPTRLVVIGPKARLSANADGLNECEVVEGWEEAQPVVFIAPARLLFDCAQTWLDNHYDYAGMYEQQSVYVRRGRDDIAAIISAWPLDP